MGERFLIKQERMGFRTQVNGLNFDESRGASSKVKSVGCCVRARVMKFESCHGGKMEEFLPGCFLLLSKV